MTDCTVSLLTNSMRVEGGNPTDITNAVQNAGYGASLKKEMNIMSDSINSNVEDELFKDIETQKLKKRLWSSVVFLVILMCVSMGYTMWGWPMPSFFEGNVIGIGLV